MCVSGLVDKEIALVVSIRASFKIFEQSANALAPVYRRRVLVSSQSCAEMPHYIEKAVIILFGV